VEVVGGGIRSQLGQVGRAGGGAEVAGGVAGFWRGVLWWGKDSRTKRYRMVVQEVGQKWQEVLQGFGG
nr:hypothetical protein [Tanacetum cinerariifolium]